MTHRIMINYYCTPRTVQMLGLVKKVTLISQREKKQRLKEDST